MIRLLTVLCLRRHDKEGGSIVLGPNAPGMSRVDLSLDTQRQRVGSYGICFVYIINFRAYMGSKKHPCSATP